MRFRPGNWIRAVLIWLSAAAAPGLPVMAGPLDPTDLPECALLLPGQGCMSLSDPVEVGAFPLGGLRRTAAVPIWRTGSGGGYSPGGWPARTGAMAARMLAAPVLKGAAEPGALRAAWRWLEDATIAATVSETVPQPASFAVPGRRPAEAVAERVAAPPQQGAAAPGRLAGMPRAKTGTTMAILPPRGWAGAAGARSGRARLSDFVLPALFLERALVLALYDGKVLEIDTQLFAVALPVAARKRLPLPVVVQPPRGFYLFAKPLPVAGTFSAPAPVPLPGAGTPFALVLLALAVSGGAMRRRASRKRQVS